MRKRRYIATNRVYHLISRLAHKAFLLTEDERSRCVDLLRRCEYFSGVVVLAYVFMDNHFHILIYVPEKQVLGNADVLDRIKRLYRGPTLTKILTKWESLEKGEYENGSADSGTPFAKFVTSFLNRMFDSSEFMRTFKQHFTLSYNGRMTHTGTMWEGRYCERNHPFDPEILQKTAAYIDFNPVKAGLVEKPEDYRWGSFYAACEGDKQARVGYSMMYDGETDWRELKELHEISLQEARIDFTQRKERQIEVTGREVSEFPFAEKTIEEQILDLLRVRPMGLCEIAAAIGKKDSAYVGRRYMHRLLAEGRVAYTNEISPRARNQKYRISE